ncbi:zinc ribbon domain-containing protein [Methanobacterium petrolearium]|uniref:zinc ribbon domain-containing protein n=1 Tax=Methanobacterium petrolearium TaxID=710190 RepID=UPI001AE626BD|nr:zinc ribbon domain-containing protein [Methanobacterium petrolearium]MBP1945397.1 hypothetical protein [Methanobacterium petrolearium]BDZ71591.1 hypothetical protein GCM10025861_21080 [Methanobacterium petrolearium]
MTKICPKCNKVNADSSQFCENCGEELSNPAKKPIKSGGFGEWWGKQGSGVKSGIIIAGICCIGLIVIIGLVGMTSPDASTTDNTSTDTNTDTNSDTTDTNTDTTATENPTEVTINQLYGSNIKEGTLVKVTGTVLQSDGYSLRMENTDGQDILVQGWDLSAYEDQSVTVVGTFIGPTSYETTIGSSRTVPTIDDAEIA